MFNGGQFPALSIPSTNTLKSYKQLKAPDRCTQLFDHERYLITDRRAHTDKHTNGRTDGRYQTYYLPCFAVDNDS